MVKRSGSAIRVMIVDGNSASRKNMTRLLLLPDDIEAVAVARTGSETIRLAPGVEPDVILLNSNVADMDVVRLIETLAKATSAEMVLVSVSSDPPFLQRALRAGARCFLADPPHADKLIETIRNL